MTNEYDKAIDKLLKKKWILWPTIIISALIVLFAFLNSGFDLMSKFPSSEKNDSDKSSQVLNVTSNNQEARKEFSMKNNSVKNTKNFLKAKNTGVSLDGNEFDNADNTFEIDNSNLDKINTKEVESLEGPKIIIDSDKSNQVFNVTSNNQEGGRKGFSMKNSSVKNTKNFLKAKNTEVSLDGNEFDNADNTFEIDNSNLDETNIKEVGSLGGPKIIMNGVTLKGFGGLGSISNVDVEINDSKFEGIKEGLTIDNSNTNQRVISQKEKELIKNALNGTSKGNVQILLPIDDKEAQVFANEIGDFLKQEKYNPTFKMVKYTEKFNNTWFFTNDSTKALEVVYIPSLPLE